MTPMLATNVLTDDLALSAIMRTTPPIVTAACVSTSSWLYSALEQVRELEASGRLIRGMGDFRITDQTAMRARIVLSTIDANFLPTPLVSPVSGGGLTITWSVGEKEVKLAFEPSGETACLKIQGDEVVEDQGINVMEHSPISEQLKWMLDLNM